MILSSIRYAVLTDVEVYLQWISEHIYIITAYVHMCTYVGRPMVHTYVLEEWHVLLTYMYVHIPTYLISLCLRSYSVVPICIHVCTYIPTYILGHMYTYRMYMYTYTYVCHVRQVKYW